MVDPVTALGFAPLRSLLARADDPARARQARRTAMSPEIERAALSVGFPAKTRLAALAALARDAQASALPTRDREDITGELDRLCLRVLWHEGLLADSPRKPRPPFEIAERLLEVAALGLLPPGPVGRMVLERARTLLRHQDAVNKLHADADARVRLSTLLEGAYGTVRCERIEQRVWPADAPTTSAG